MKTISFNRKIVLAAIAILVIILAGIVALTFYDNNSDETGEIPTYYTHGSYVIDISNPEELSGQADYVFVGKVDKIAGTEYLFPVMVEVMSDGKIKEVEVADPYTNYYVTVIENIKGELVQNQSIPVLKQGGISKDGRFYVLPEGDFMPEEGKTYVFYTNTLSNGTLLIPGAKTNIEIKTDDVNSESVKNSSAYQIAVKAVENQKENKRERFVSTYDLTNENVTNN
ncbi:hypothetical protein [Methanolapillus millepedarum]|uniref:Uncharacterized protein n=1 Tax=Methanolapillus millepedarum TaxID=3028296 RepID=A0AA96V4E3_9EURY|nr:hypothetical protein MsAc7_08700 [Methanosarcinaceae archaeon Ac7]